MTKTLKIEITPDNSVMGYKQGTLNASKKEILNVLGFLPNIEDDPAKVVDSWGFKIGLRDEPCAIWDYKGSQHENRYSTFGPHEIFQALFGSQYSPR